MARAKAVRKGARGPMREAHKKAIAEAMKVKWKQRQLRKLYEEPAEAVVPQAAEPASAPKRRTLSVILMEMAEAFKTLDALRNELADYLE